MLWHAFLFLGLRFFPPSFFLLGGLQCFFACKNFYNIYGDRNEHVSKRDNFANYKKSSNGIHQQRRRKENMHISLSPWSMKARNNSCTSLVQGITEIGTQRAMKKHKKTLHELPTHISTKSTKGNKCRPMYKVLHSGITFSS
jgi:hypothetical protein